eukprot:1629948-Pleurochrysis_carterae.AAC.4
MLLDAATTSRTRLEMLVDEARLCEKHQREVRRRDDAQDSQPRRQHVHLQQLGRQGALQPHLPALRCGASSERGESERADANVALSTISAFLARIASLQAGAGDAVSESRNVLSNNNDNGSDHRRCTNNNKASDSTAKNSDDKSDDSREVGSMALSTIHGSKGREWHAVLCVRFNEGECPLVGQSDAAATGPIRTHTEPEHARIDPGYPQKCSDKYPHKYPREQAREQARVEEERRLAYVAMTRAKEQLIVSCIARDDDGRPVAPSRFLHELPAALVRWQHVEG